MSAVVKLMRVVRLPAGMPLYRGLGGAVALPESFCQADGNGCRGYTEWGFLSTTSSRAVAVEVKRAAPIACDAVELRAAFRVGVRYDARHACDAGIGTLIGW